MSVTLAVRLGPATVRLDRLADAEAGRSRLLDRPEHAGGDAAEEGRSVGGALLDGYLENWSPYAGPGCGPASQPTNQCQFASPRCVPASYPTNPGS